MRTALTALLALPALALRQPLTTAQLLLEYGAPVPLPPPRYLTHPRNASAPTTLRAAAAARGLFMGAAINQALFTDASEPAYAATFLSEFSLATCENGCKFSPTEPTEGAFDFAECDFIASAALQQGKGHFRGHNFVWGVYNPSWLQPLSGADKRAAMQAHIGALLAHYAASPLPAFLCWDVVNEAVCDTGSNQYNCTQGATFKTVEWSPSGDGPGGYVENAFRFAAAASGAQRPLLFYNDYSAEASGSPKSDKVYAMLKDMLSRGVPITGVGLQMHISVDGYPNPAAVADNIARLGALGLTVHITEMDVKCSNCTPRRLELQAAVYGHMLSACLNHSSVCKSFETWGVTDKHSWLGTDVSPLLFDTSYAKKPAYFELLAVLNS